MPAAAMRVMTRKWMGRVDHTTVRRELKLTATRSAVTAIYTTFRIFNVTYLLIPTSRAFPLLRQFDYILPQKECDHDISSTLKHDFRFQHAFRLGPHAHFNCRQSFEQTQKKTLSFMPALDIPETLIVALWAWYAPQEKFAPLDNKSPSFLDANHSRKMCVCLAFHPHKG